jgi:hypothetical protein
MSPVPVVTCLPDLVTEVNMLEIRRTAVSFQEMDLMELERIVTDSDKEEALRFLKKSVYARILQAQQGRLKSHLNAGGDTVSDFHSKTDNISRTR